MMIGKLWQGDRSCIVLVECVQFAPLEGLEFCGLELLGDPLDHLSQTKFLRNKGFGNTDYEILTSSPAASVCTYQKNALKYKPLIS